MCSLSDPGLDPSVYLYFLYTTLNPKACKINNASRVSAESKCMTFLRGGGESPEKRSYDVSRGQNRYVTLP